MARKDFKQAMELRVQERVDARVQRFRKDVGEAVDRLLDGMDPSERHAASKVVCEALQYLRPSSDMMRTAQFGVLDNGQWKTKTIGWPQELWAVERERVNNEVRATLDAVQLMFMAPERTDESAVSNEQAG